MSENIIAFLLSSLRAATPLIFCVLSVIIAEKSGVLHIGVEGVMLSGALAGFLGVVYTGNVAIGLLVTAFTGIVCGIILAGLTIYLPSDQVVAGIVFNIFCLGITSFVFRMAAEKNAAVQGIIPAVPTLFFIPPFTVAAFILAIGLWWFLFKTGPGLKIRSVGEGAHAAHAAGIDVVRVRAIVMLCAAMLSAFGGASLSIGWVRSYIENITLGRGFIALAAAYCGRWNPVLATAACIIFGAGEALSFRAQAAGSGNPHYYFMIPYVLTTLVVGLAGRGRAPADVSKHYIRR